MTPYTGPEPPRDKLPYQEVAEDQQKTIDRLKAENKRLKKTMTAIQGACPHCGGSNMAHACIDCMKNLGMAELERKA